MAMVAVASQNAAVEEPYAEGNWHSVEDATGCQEGLAEEGDMAAQESWAEVAAAVAVPVGRPWPAGPAKSPAGAEQMLPVRREAIAAGGMDDQALGTGVAATQVAEGALKEHLTGATALRLLPSSESSWPPPVLRGWVPQRASSTTTAMTMMTVPRHWIWLANLGYTRDRDTSRTPIAWVWALAQRARQRRSPSRPQSQRS